MIRLLERKTPILKLVTSEITLLNTWTPIGLETRRFQRGKGVSCYRIVRKQFPFVVAEALTIESG